MLEGRKSQFVDEMTKQGLSLKQANEEVNLSIERLSTMQVGVINISNGQYGKSSSIFTFQLFKP